MCIYVCMYIYVYIYIYIHTRICCLCGRSFCQCCPGNKHLSNSTTKKMSTAEMSAVCRMKPMSSHPRRTSRRIEAHVIGLASHVASHGLACHRTHGVASSIHITSSYMSSPCVLMARSSESIYSAMIRSARHHRVHLSFLLFTDAIITYYYYHY